MEITSEALNEFVALWKEDHPNEIVDEAQIKEVALLTFMAIEITFGHGKDEDGLS